MIFFDVILSLIEFFFRIFYILINNINIRYLNHFFIALMIVLMKICLIFNMVFINN